MQKRFSALAIVTDEGACCFLSMQIYAVYVAVKEWFAGKENLSSIENGEGESGGRNIKEKEVCGRLYPI